MSPEAHCRTKPSDDFSPSADTVLPPSLTLLACQISIPETTTAEARDRHVSRTARQIEQRLIDAPVDLVVLPELSSIDYSRAAFDRLTVLAEDLHGPSFDIWSPLAAQYGTTIVYGIARKASEGYYISQVVLGPDGALIGHFDKIHVAQYGASMEKEYFQRSSQLFLFDINGIRISPIICYDIRVPELTRTLCVKHGAELILHCGAYARDPSFHSWHQFVLTRALENQVFIMSLNRAGPEFGASMFCPPWVDTDLHPIHFGNDETFRRIEVDTQQIVDARRTYPFLKDRLADYGELPLRSSAPNVVKLKRG